MLSITLIFNTFAWFLYMTEVSTKMNVHVDSWSISFKIDDEELQSREVQLDINQAYPGMLSVDRYVQVVNKGEKIANVSYTFYKVRVIDTTYVVRDLLSSEEILELDGNENEVTEEELAEILSTQYPFRMYVTNSATSLSTGDASDIHIRFEWDYEGGDDDLDTQYGVDSYTYYQNNEGQPAIQAKVKLVARQQPT